jgi:hypothetical protein
MHLGELIEEAIKNNAKEDNAKEVDLELGEDSDIEDIERSLKDEDFKDYSDFIDEQNDQDDEYMKSILEEDAG